MSSDNAQLSFEVLLNPSVPAEAELRLSRQVEKMYRLFVEAHKAGLPVSNTELAKICFQYQARLYELRRALITLGWCVSRKAGFMLSTRIDCDVDVDSSGLRQNSDKTHDLDVESKNSGQR